MIRLKSNSGYVEEVYMIVESIHKKTEIYPAYRNGKMERMTITFEEKNYSVLIKDEKAKATVEGLYFKNDFNLLHFDENILNDLHSGLYYGYRWFHFRQTNPMDFLMENSSSVKFLKQEDEEDWV